MDLKTALEVVRAAGYRVTKPAAKKSDSRVGPTCVVAFADGEVCRMSTHTPHDKPDFARGIKQCVAAWQTRQRIPIGRQLKHYDRARFELSLEDNKKTLAARVAAREYAKYLVAWENPVLPTPPAVLAAHFEDNGNVIARYQP